MSLTRHIPNALTLGNVACGSLGILAVLEGRNIELAAIFMAMGLVFDFLDGMMARLLKVASPLGKQLDSLADMVTFGVLPGAVVYYLMDGNSMQWLALAVPVFSALRLGKFNIDERQSEDFIGMPTPAHAIFWMGYALWRLDESGGGVIDNPLFIGLLALATSVLTVSNVRMISLKFKSLGWQKNKARWIFLLLAVLLIICCVLVVKNLFLSVPIVILLYLLISIINNLLHSRNEVQS